MKLLAAILVAFALLWNASQAEAQSNNCQQYLTYGNVLTPAQWQYCFSLKTDVGPSGPGVNIIAIGTGLAITTGTLNTTGALASIFALTPAEGDVMCFNGSQWVNLAAGTSGYLLASQGVSGCPHWISASGTGTVTSIIAGTGLSGGTITTSGTVALAAIANGSFLGNTSGSSAAPTAQTVGAGLSFASGSLVVASNGVANAMIRQGAANSVIGNISNSTANVANVAIPSCPDTGGNHLNWVSGTGPSCGSTSAGGAFSAYCISSQTALPGLSATATVSHSSGCASGAGFSGIPFGVQVFMIETDAGGDCSWAQNKQINAPIQGNSVGAGNTGFVYSVDTSNVVMLESNNTPSTYNASTAGQCTISPSKWALIVEAWK
jgi:hypothetical protein